MTSDDDLVPVSTDSSTGADLPVPEAARRAYDEVMTNLLLVAKDLREPNSGPVQNIPRIAAPVVAAELRRIAREFGGEYVAREQQRQTHEARHGRDYTGQHFNSAVGQAAQALYDRADELDGGAT